MGKCSLFFGALCWLVCVGLSVAIAFAWARQVSLLNELATTGDFLDGTCLVTHSSYSCGVERSVDQQIMPPIISHCKSSVQCVVAFPNGSTTNYFGVIESSYHDSTHYTNCTYDACFEYLPHRDEIMRAGWECSDMHVEADWSFGLTMIVIVFLFCLCAVAGVTAVMIMEVKKLCGCAREYDPVN